MKYFLILMLTLSSLNSYAKTPAILPLWEVGAGVLNFRTDHYRGSAQNNWYHWPIPAFIYRGKDVEADNALIRRHIFKREKYTIDLSFNFGLNVNSDRDALRKGMPDLGPIFEVGPMFRYYLWKSKDGTHFLNFEMPYRAVYATDLKKVEHVGYYSIPYLALISKASPDTFSFSTEFSAGVSYGSTNYHDYFYGVSRKYATPERNHYSGVSGYSGFQLAAVVSRRFNNFLVTPFIRWDYLDKVAFQNSPVFKNRNYTLFGLAFTWYFFQSDKGQEAPTLVR